jgi:hypothetical protein
LKISFNAARSQGAYPLWDLRCQLQLVAINFSAIPLVSSYNVLAFPIQDKFAGCYSLKLIFDIAAVCSKRIFKFSFELKAKAIPIGAAVQEARCNNAAMEINIRAKK